jgi:hypothetical protein
MYRKKMSYFELLMRSLMLQSAMAALARFSASMSSSEGSSAGSDEPPNHPAVKNPLNMELALN